MDKQIWAIVYKVEKQGRIRKAKLGLYVAVGFSMVLFRDKVPQELCRMKRAVKALIKQNPDGMTHSDICRRLQQESIIAGTYRNLLSQTSSVLRLLIEEGAVISKGSGALKIFLYAG
jgi:hypothetical protein